MKKSELKQIIKECIQESWDDGEAGSEWTGPDSPTMTGIERVQKHIVSESDEDDIDRGSLPRETQEKNAIELFKMAKTFHKRLSVLTSIKNVIVASNLKLKEIGLGRGGDLYDNYDEDIITDIEEIYDGFADGLTELEEFIKELEKIERGLKTATRPEKRSFFGHTDKPAMNYDVSTETSIVKPDNK